MDLQNIEKRMNEISDAINNVKDLDELNSLEKEYNGLNEQRTAILNARSKVVKVDLTGNQITKAGAVLMNPGVNDKDKRTDDPYGTLEYRMAFKEYAQRGTPIPAEFRAGGDAGTTVSTDVSAIIPTTIMNKFVEEVAKVYGQVYTKVRKLNIRGGVKFPVSNLKANFKWITETTPSAKQKVGDVKTYVEFSYHMGEIRIASTLLANIVTLDAFETEVVRVLTEAYIKEMDNAIINGTGTGQPLGIAKDPRITNVVSFTNTTIGDWTAWRKSLFAKIPLSLRGQGEFLFPASTVESYLMTMKDTSNRPLFKEATEGTMGNLAGTFFGRNITLVEPDIIKDFDTASANDVIGIYGKFDEYAINTNMQMTYRRYFDEDSNEYIDKAIVIVDGKPLNANAFWLIKKGGE